MRNGVSGQNGKNVRSLAEVEPLQEIEIVLVPVNAAEMILKSERAIHQLVISLNLGQAGQIAVFHVVAREFRSDLKLAMTRQQHVMARMRKFGSVQQKFVPNGLNGPSTVPVTQYAEVVLPPEHVNAWVLANVRDQPNQRSLVIITSVLVGLIGLHGHLVLSRVVA